MGIDMRPLSETGLRTLETERRRALVEGDIAALDRLLAPGFVYQHGTGARQEKAEFLRLVAAGAYSYRDIVSTDEWVLIHGDVALLVATVHFHVTTNGNDFVAVRRATHVWVRDEAGWRFAAYQGCIPAPEDVRLEEAAQEPAEVKAAMGWTDAAD